MKESLTNLGLVDALNIVEGLSKLKTGALLGPVFYQVCRLVVISTVELIPILPDGQVLMLRRPDTDPFWPNKLHFPGKVIMPTDKDVDATVDRILNNELYGSMPAPYTDHGYVCTVEFRETILQRTERGCETAWVHVCHLNKSPDGFETFWPNALPEDMIEHHKDLVDRFLL